MYKAQMMMKFFKALIPRIEKDELCEPSFLEITTTSVQNGITNAASSTTGLERRLSWQK